MIHTMSVGFQPEMPQTAECFPCGGKPTVDVIGVDVLDGGAADVGRLGPQSDAPQLVHPAQLERERERERQTDRQTDR